MNDDLIMEMLDLFPDICQLLDGWHCDTAWTEWDESVRKRCSELQRKMIDYISEIKES